MKHHIIDHGSDKLTSSSSSSMRVLIFFLGSWRDQTFFNIIERSNQWSVQLYQSFSTVLIKYREQGTHVSVVAKLHLGELDASIWIGWWTMILYIAHRLCVSDNWFGPTDLLTQTMRHQHTPLTYLIFLHFSKLQLTWCLDLANKCLWLFTFYCNKWTKHTNL